MRLPRVRSFSAVLLLVALSPAAGGAAPGEVVRATLAEAIERARGQSPTVARLGALEEAAAARVEVARAARRAVVELGAGYARSSDVPEFVAPGSTRPIFPNLPDTYRSRVAISIPVHTGGGLEARIAAADRGREAAGLDRARGEADVVLETTAAYWSLVAAIETERVLAEAIRSYEAHRIEAGNRVELGLSARDELLAVEVRKERAELARLAAANAALVAEAAVAVLLGLDPPTRFEPVDSPEGLATRSGAIEPLVVEALRARPERGAVAARAESAEARIEGERSARRPQLAATAGYDFANPNRKILPPSARWDDTWDVGIGLNWLLADGGRSRAATAAARAEARAARLELDELDRRIRLEVTRAALDLDTALASGEVAGRSLDSARENVRVSRDRYRAGLIPSSELLDAETALLLAGLDRTNALIRARTASAELDRALGRRSR